MLEWRKISRLKKRYHFGASNGGWKYDSYPELESLDAGKTMTIAEIKGPAVITNFHSTQHFIQDPEITKEQRKGLSLRGLILEIYFNNNPIPSVRVPLGDFFADGCLGRAEHFTSFFIEKAPQSYNCFIPMPFEKSARVVLVNETKYDLMNYSFVEFENLESWDENLGYFHATWKRFAFQLDGNTNIQFFHVNGKGHLIGRSYSISTDELLFRDFTYVMEGNNEIRIDGEDNPRVDYLGTEDSFGFSWGFQKVFNGLFNGINYVNLRKPTLLSIYRFRGNNTIGFNKSLDLRINWTNERLFKSFQKSLSRKVSKDRCWIDYATTYYWYQSTVGYDHEKLMPLNERIKLISKSNLDTK
ncbi:MAG: DUF2961 domain-containing protein [Candidatus Helarchaeota archaeon]|nr:DUF2961 domain-containing protein [Candidatus Helarchaeota archaeon]